jgi:hypothetical protein
VSAIAPVPKRSARDWSIAAIVLIVAAAAMLRLPLVAKGQYWYIDEEFTVAIVKQVDKSGSLDTNWKLADMNPAFRRPMYNFSGYFVTLHGLKLLTRAILPEPPPLEEIRELRAYTAGFAIVALVVTALLGFTLGGGTAAVASTLLVAISPSLMMESYYARPDTLFVMLSLVLLLVYLRRAELPRTWIGIAALLVGFLVSIKASAVVFALLLLPGFARAPLRGLLVAAAGLFLGFAAGAPGAVAHPGDYFEGLAFLRDAYMAGVPPHGLGPEASVPERMAYGATWLWQTSGLALVLAAAGAGALARQRRWDVLYGFAPFAATIVYFATTPAFLERNLSPGIAAFALLAGLGVESAAIAVRSLRQRAVVAHAIAGGVALALMAWYPAVGAAKVLHALCFPVDPGAENARIARQFGRDVFVVGYLRPAPDELAAEDAKRGRPIVEIHWAYDRRTAVWLDGLKAHGWTEVARHDSLFRGYVPSTFHTVLDAPMVYLAKG